MRRMFYGAKPWIFGRAGELRKKQTETEKLLWLHLKRNQLGVRFKRQHPIWNYIADFYCHELKLVIEVDGSIHNVKEVMEKDLARQNDIISLGITVIRFTNKEVTSDINNVIDRIKEKIKQIKGDQACEKPD